MRLSDIDLRLLRVFKAVAEAGGFVKAQDHLGISQPAISSHIANLEQRVNARLCNRGPQGFSLTSQGQDILDETVRLLAHLESYADRLSEIGGKSPQSARIGVVDCLTTDPANPLASAISSVHSSIEDMQIRIGVYDYLDCLTELRAGRLDLAIVGIGAEENVPDDLERKQLYEELGGLFCTPDHPCNSASNPEQLTALLKFSKISAHSFLSSPIDEKLDILLFDENEDISQSNIESTTYLTLAGTHVGLIPEHYVRHWVELGELVAIAPETYGFVTQIHAVRARSASHGNLAKRIWSEFDA